MAVYFFAMSQFAQRIWGNLAGAGIGIFIVLLMFLGIFLMLGALGARSAGKTTKGFLKIIQTIVSFVALKWFWRFLKFFAKKVGKLISRLWKWLNATLKKAFQLKFSMGASTWMARVGTIIVMIVIAIII